MFVMFNSVMSVQIDIVYKGGLSCEATHAPSKKTLITDAPLDNGGKGRTFSPTDLVGAALGACMETIIGLVAQRNNLNVEGLKIEVTKEMVADPVRRIGALKTRIIFPKGINYTREIKLKLEAAAKTCPVKQSLHPDINISLDFIYPD